MSSSTSAVTVPTALRLDFFFVLELLAVGDFAPLLALPVADETEFRSAFVVAFGIGPLLDHVAVDVERIMRSSPIVPIRVHSNHDRPT
jgi:hypothetical protein